MDLDDKGRKTPVFSTNVFITSRARKGIRIRQENRISIILILTERIVMLYTPSTCAFSWKRIFFLTCWRQGGQSKKRESWKVKTQAERALFSAWKLLHWGEARKTENMSQTKVTKFCLFIPEKDKTQGSTDPVSTVASWKGHPCGEKLHFWPYALSFSTSYLHPWVLHVHGTEVTISHCQTCAQSQQLLSCKHCQEAFLLAFFKATPIWHPSFTVLCFLPHIFLQLSKSCCFRLQDLCFWRQLGMDCLLLALWKYKIMTCLLLLWTGAIQKRQCSWQLLEKWCPSDRLLFKT